MSNTQKILPFLHLHKCGTVEKMFVQQILAILVLVKTLEIDGFPTSSKVDETLIGSVDVAMPQIQTIEVRKR